MANSIGLQKSFYRLSIIFIRRHWLRLEWARRPNLILSAIDEAVRQFDADEVPQEGRVLYVNTDLKSALNNAVTRR